MSKEIYQVRVPVSMTLEQREKLQKIAKQQAISMNQLIRNGIDLIIKKSEKKG